MSSRLQVLSHQLSDSIAIMTPSQKSAVNVIFGAMTFGREGTEQARVYTQKDCEAILDIFQAHGHNEVDTARFYGEGSSEEFLGDLDWKKRGIVMDTKYCKYSATSGIPRPHSSYMGRTY